MFSSEAREICPWKIKRDQNVNKYMEMQLLLLLLMMMMMMMMEGLAGLSKHSTLKYTAQPIQKRCAANISTSKVMLHTAASIFQVYPKRYAPRLSSALDQRRIPYRLVVP